MATTSPASAALQEIYNVGGGNWWTALKGLVPTTSGLNRLAGRLPGAAGNISRASVPVQAWEEAQAAAKAANVARGTGTFESAAEGMFANAPAGIQKFTGTLNDFFNTGQGWVDKLPGLGILGLGSDVLTPPVAPQGSAAGSVGLVGPSGGPSRPLGSRYNASEATVAASEGRRTTTTAAPKAVKTLAKSKIYRNVGFRGRR
jgi:hypothetical protein